MNNNIGWVIYADDAESPQVSRIGWGQVVDDAQLTQDAFDNVIARTIYMSKDLKLEDIPVHNRVRWISFSDDGDIGYSGVIDINWIFGLVGDDDDDLAYNVDRFCLEDRGDPIVVYSREDLASRGDEHVQIYVEHHTSLLDWRPDSVNWVLTNPQNWLPFYS